MAADERDEHTNMNRDPITDEPGAHPVGTAVGSTGGALAGGAAGAIAGPIGAAIGGVIGAVVGGLAGKAAGEAINPTAEEAYWRDNYSREPYYRQGRSFDDYGPAYRLGLSGRTRYEEEDWTTIEPRLASEWESNRGGSALDWNDAGPASHAAWHRADDQIRTYHGANAGSGALAGAGMGSTPGMAGTGAAGAVGAMQQAGDNSGSHADTIDVLQDLVECCKDGEFGFRESAEQVKRQDLKTTLLQHADDCRRGAQELNELIRQCGGKAEDDGSAMGALHRGWVSIKAKLTTYDDKAVLVECERGEDNAKARYMKALEKPLPAHVKAVVERQYQGVVRNHDHVKMLRDSM